MPATSAAAGRSRPGLARGPGGGRLRSAPHRGRPEAPGPASGGRGRCCRLGPRSLSGGGYEQGTAPRGAQPATRPLPADHSWVAPQEWRVGHLFTSCGRGPVDGPRPDDVIPCHEGRAQVASPCSPARDIRRIGFRRRLVNRRHEEVPAASRATPWGEHAPAGVEPGVQGDHGLGRRRGGAIGVGTRERAIVVDDHHPVARSHALRCPEHGVMVALVKPAWAEPIGLFSLPCNLPDRGRGCPRVANGPAVRVARGFRLYPSPPRGRTPRGAEFRRGRGPRCRRQRFVLAHRTRTKTPSLTSSMTSSGSCAARLGRLRWDSSRSPI